MLDVADDELLQRIDEHMARGNEHMARGNELMEEIREEHRLSREEHRLNRAAVHSMQEVAKEVVLELREHRELIRDVRHGIQAQTEGLMHVLDELRRRNGPGGEATA